MGVFSYIKMIVKNSLRNISGGRFYGGSSGSVFDPYGADPYVSDLVNAAIERRATEISKLDIKSVLFKNDAVIIVNDDITRLFKYAPNSLQTTSDFLATIEWQRLKTGNAIIYPQYNWVDTAAGRIKKFTAFWVLNTNLISMIVDDKGEVFYQINIKNDEMITLPSSEIIHMKWRRGTNPILGGDDNGHLENSDLLSAVTSLNKIFQGLPKALESSLQVKGMYVPNSIMDTDRLKEVRDELEKHIYESGSGIVATDLSGTFTPMRITPAEIQEPVLKFIKSAVSERYGVSLEVLSGSPTYEQHEAFYQTAIEDFIVQFEQAFSMTLYTQREQDIGHKLRAYYGRLKRLGASEITAVATLSTNTGLFEIDELRDMYGYPPLPNGEGKKRMISLNFIDADEANKYQVGENNSTKGGANE